MAAGSSSGEEAAAGTGPAPQEIQEQAAPTMMSMMALLVEKVGGLQETVDQDMLIVSGHDQDDKYREWSILEEIEKIWIRLVDQHVERITKSALMSREQISDYKDRYMDKKSKQRYHVKWDMVKGLHNLA